MSRLFYKFAHLIPKIELYKLAVNYETGISKYIEFSKLKTQNSNNEKIKTIINTLINVNQIEILCNFYGVIKCVTLWMDNHIISTIKNIQNIKTLKIQRFVKNHIYRKKIEDIREYKYLSSENKVRMALYATMHDSRSLMGLNYEEKMQIPIFVWILGIVKDGRVYKYLPEEIKNNPDPAIGVFFAKILIECGDWYPRFIPNHIRSIIEQ